MGRLKGIWGLAWILVLLVSHPAASQENDEDELHRLVLQLDQTVFAAFNDRDREVFIEYFSTELEFYHDVDGLTGYPEFIESSHRLFGLESPLRRELVEGSVEVHAVPGYGAIQIGEHEFCHWEADTYDCGVFGFTHLWQQTGDGWQITRVYSYGH